MQRILVAALATAALAGGSPAASAGHERRHVGGCHFLTVDDTTGGENLEWKGEIDIRARTVTAGDVPTVEPISVGCELLVNGYSRRIVASASGTGVVVHVEEFRFHASHADLVTMCDHVEVSGHASVECRDSFDGPILPPYWDPFRFVLDLLAAQVWSRVDPVVCAVLPLHAGQYGPVLIDGSGDVYMFGDTPDHLWWDCPPYEYP